MNADINNFNSAEEVGFSRLTRALNERQRNREAEKQLSAIRAERRAKLYAHRTGKYFFSANASAPRMTYGDASASIAEIFARQMARG